ncbi:8784_t:CDS:2, partial [Ambispora leptoticha]
GINAMMRKILMNYEWGVRNVYNDVKGHVTTCDICQRCEGKITKEPIYVPATSWIFHKLFVDCIGPLPRTSGGHKYIVVDVEDLTGFIEARPLRKKNAKSIAKLVSDRGTEFKNTLVDELTSRLGVEQCFSSSYHPEANRRAEQTIQKLTRILRKVCAERQNRWHEDAIAPIELTLDSYQ